MVDRLSCNLEVLSKTEVESIKQPTKLIQCKINNVEISNRRSQKFIFELQEKFDQKGMINDENS